MLTSKRQILFSTDNRILSLVDRFEGIELISDANEVPSIWALNKTPLLSTRVFNCLEIPKYEDSNFIKNFTQWCHDNSFECGEYSSGKVFDTRDEPCVLCAIAHHKGITPSTFVYNAHVDKEVDMIIYESQNFLVVPELGSLKPGFVMIIPKQHRFLSIAQLEDSLFPEYFQVCRDVEIILKGAFGDRPVTFFEHGSGPSGLTSHKKSIVHAHTHVVIDFVIEQKYLDMVQCKPLDDIRRARNTHYFAYWFNEKLYCCYDPRVFVQRQFPRQIMSLTLGHAPEQYNWRKHPWFENISQTLFFIHKFLKNGKINERIQERTKAFTRGYEIREN